MSRRSQSPGVSWAQVKLNVSREQYDQLAQLAADSAMSAAQHMRLAVLAYLVEDESAWAGEAAALARQGRLAQSFEEERWLSCSFSPEHKARLRERAQVTGLPLATHLRLALSRYLASVTETAPTS